MQTLEQWLDVATSGLCESAADRVRAEIGEHYASALEAAAADDADPIDAERLAVDALGDAKTANRQYRRVLLTASEEELLRGFASCGGQR
jgi:GTP cyclohydrolase III